MAHFAKIVDGRVETVVVVDNEFEERGEEYLHGLGLEGRWIKTSFNTRGNVHLDPETLEPDGGVPLRYNFATPDGFYDEAADAFYDLAPFDSWQLDENFVWQPPHLPPADGQIWVWNEEALDWQVSDISSVVYEDGEPDYEVE